MVLFAACSTPKKEQNRLLVTAYRLAGSLPAMLGGYLVYQFDKVLDFTGVFGMLICMVFPGLLFEFSRKACAQRWPASEEVASQYVAAVLGWVWAWHPTAHHRRFVCLLVRYSHWFSNLTMSRTIVVIGFIGLIAGSVQQFIDDF